MRELIEETSRLLDRAVAQRSQTVNHKVGIALSGGRDSRIILCHLADKVKEINAVTFGKKNSLEIDLATKAAKRFGINHYVQSLNSGNWLLNRVQNVWWSDGQSSFLHLNGDDGLNKDRKVYHACFTGLGGEALAGKNHLFDPENPEIFIKNKCKNRPNCDNFRERLTSEIISNQTAEVFYLSNRFRRFSNCGLRIGESGGVRSRVPFMGYDLMEFLHSIPLHFKKKLYLYDTILVRKFPQVFQDIRWPKNNISTSNPHKYRFIRHKLNLRLKKSLISRKRYKKFLSPVDYADWLRKETAKGFINKLLFDQSPLLYQYISYDEVKGCWEDHISGLDKAVMVCRYATLEIWLNQLFQEENEAITAINDMRKS